MGQPQVIVASKPENAQIIMTPQYYAVWRSDTGKFLQEGVDQKTRAPYKWGDYAESICTNEALEMIDNKIKDRGDDYEPEGIEKQNPFFLDVSVFVPVTLWGATNCYGVAELYFEPDFVRSMLL